MDFANGMGNENDNIMYASLGPTQKPGGIRAFG